MEPATVVIDGECGLCTRASHYGMRHASPGLLRFVASQSDEGQGILGKHGLVQTADDTMVAVVGDRPYVRSAAVVKIAARLRWPYRAQAIFWLVPRPIRNAGYRWVSRRRKRFGPPPPQRNH